MGRKDVTTMLTPYFDGYLFATLQKCRLNLIVILLIPESVSYIFNACLSHTRSLANARLVHCWSWSPRFICGSNVDCNVFIYCLHLCCSTFGSKLRALIFRVYAEVKIHYHFSDVGQPNLVVLFFLCIQLSQLLKVDLFSPHKMCETSCKDCWHGLSLVAVGLSCELTMTQTHLKWLI